MFCSGSDPCGEAFSPACTRDILVVGFDNIELSSMTSPSITTVNQPKFQMGYTACEMLLELMEDPHEEMKSLLLDTELVIREST